MPNISKVVVSIQNEVDDFADDIPALEKKLLREVSSLLKELSLDSEGNIKVNITNMRIIDKVKKTLIQVLDDPQYVDNIVNLKDTINDIGDLQTAYFANSFTDFEVPKNLEILKKQAYQDTVDSLTGAGIDENVVNHVVDIVKDGINEGTNFYDLNDQIKTALVGDEEVDSKLLSYTKQVLNDSLHGVARNYNANVTKDLGLVWYRYVGGLVKTSRDWCIAMEHKEFIHESELSKCCRGDIDGEKVSLAGLMPDTNKTNVINRAGGFNCEHHMVPVSSSSVPSKIRRIFEPDIEQDEDEASDERPTRK